MLIDTCRKTLRLKHYAWKTEQSYLRIIRQFVHFSGFKSMGDMRATPEVFIERFLTEMVEKRDVSASTQNVALSALLFLYAALRIPVGDVDALRAKRGKTMTELPDKGDVLAILNRLTGKEKLACQLMFGCALRISEVARLRIKNLDFIHGEILIHEPKHGTDRPVMLPKSLVAALHSQIESARRLYDEDRAIALAGVHLPHALAVKYPTASTQFRFFWLFPSPNTAIDPQTGLRRRHHVSIAHLQHAVSRAANALNIEGFHCHSFRHSAAHELLMNGYQPGAIQELLGHKDISTTMGYLHSTPRGGVREIVSPLD